MNLMNDKTCLLALAWTFCVAAEAAPPVQVTPPMLLALDQSAPQFRLPDAERVLPQPQAASVLIRQVQFRGHTVFSDEVLQNLARPYLNRPLDPVQDLELLRTELTKFYVERGYINSGALLDKMSTADALEGVLRVEIIEGRLNETRISGLDGLAPGYVQDRLWPDAARVFNMNELQSRFQMLLSDPLFKKIQSRVEPGAERGQALLDLNIERARPWEASIGFDNHRSPLSGEDQYSFAGTLRNLTGLGDTLDISTNAPLTGSSTQAWAVSARVPLGPWQTQVGVNYSQGQTAITDTKFASLGLSSDTDSTAFTLSQPLLETLQQNLAVGFETGQRKSQDYAGGQPWGFSLCPADGTGRIQNRVDRYSVNYVWRDPDSALSGRLTHTRGKNNCTGIPNNPAPAPQASYQIDLWQLVYSQKLTAGGLTLVARYNNQKTGAVLLGMEKFAVTSLNAVRGYAEGQNAYDNVETLSLDLQIPLAASSDMALTLTPFRDWGLGRDVYDYSTQTPGQPYSFGSIGLALQATFQNRVSLSLTYAEPLTSKKLVTPGYNQSHGWMYQMRYSF